MVEINPAYLNEGTLKQLKKAFKQDPDLPSVVLHDFLTKEGYSKILKSAKKWKHFTIPDKFAYAKSPARLGLHEFAKKATGKQPIEYDSMLLQHRDFTLLHDGVKEKAGVLGLYFLTDWDESFGGDLVFMKKGEMLGRITPKKNMLLLVHRKRGVQSFWKYVNHRAGKNALVVISMK